MRQKKTILFSIKVRFLILNSNIVCHMGQGNNVTNFYRYFALETVSPMGKCGGISTDFQFNITKNRLFFLLKCDKI